MNAQPQFSEFSIPIAMGPSAAVETLQNAHFDVLLERQRYLRYSAALAESRKARCAESIAHWTMKVCEALDAVGEAQDRFKAIRRHWQ